MLTFIDLERSLLGVSVFLYLPHDPDARASFEVVSECLGERLRQDSAPVLLALAVTHDDLAIVEVQVFDSEADTFHQPQSSAVEQACHEIVCAGHLSQHPFDFINSEDDRDAPGAFCALDACNQW
ncbi:MAG TPA: hypothetical protein VGC66_23385 [Pyrinomonadaceae bacterium]